MGKLSISLRVFIMSGPELIEAAKKGDAKKIEELIKNGADIEFVDTIGYDKRALHWAAQEGHLAAVKVLVKAGAEIDAPNRFDRNSLYMAAWYGHFEVSYWLWRQGASKYQLDKWGEQGAFAYDAKKIEELIKNGADIEFVDT